MRMDRLAFEGPKLDFSGYNSAGAITKLGADSFDEDLGWILERFSTALGASGSLLTVHTDQGRSVSAIAGMGPSLSSAAEAQDLVAQIATRSPIFAGITSFSRDSSCWIEKTPQAGFSLLCLALPSEYGAQVVITLLFEGTATERMRNDAKATSERFFPVLAGYFRLWRRHRFERCRASAFTSALDFAGFGVILLDKAKVIRYANAYAIKLLGSGRVLRRIGKELAATNVRESLKMHVAIDHAVAANASGSGEDRRYVAPHLAMSGNGQEQHIALAVPVERPATEPSDAAAILFVFAPGEDSARLVEPVCDLYRLSPVEKQLACKLAGGLSLAEAAKAMKLKDATARSYLKQIFVKTDTHRQAELVRLLLISTLKMHGDIEFVAV